MRTPRTVKGARDAVVAGKDGGEVPETEERSVDETSLPLWGAGVRGVPGPIKVGKGKG